MKYECLKLEERRIIEDMSFITKPAARSGK